MRIEPYDTCARIFETGERTQAGVAVAAQYDRQTAILPRGAHGVAHLPVHIDDRIHANGCCVALADMHDFGSEAPRQRRIDAILQETPRPAPHRDSLQTHVKRHFDNRRHVLRYPESWPRPHVASPELPVHR